MVQLPTFHDTLENAPKGSLRRVSFGADSDCPDKNQKDSSASPSAHGCSKTQPIHLLCTSASEAAPVQQQGPTTGSSSTAPAGTVPAQQHQQQLLRCGHAADRGRRHNMEDAAVIASLEGSVIAPDGAACASPSVLLAVFDGHNGSHAAEFASQHILHGVTRSKHFHTDVRTALADAFVQIDQQYYAALQGCTGDSAGTTALAALVLGGTLYVANAGDSRAVISQSGKAIDLTRDHKPHVPTERQRILSSGGFVCTDGLLNGELGVARAIGDYHIPELKQPDAGGPSPLTAEPEVTTHTLQEGDEFLLLGCDGLWDVFPSQRAVEFARARLREHNDPQRCAQELVDEALRMHTSDNVTVICCCFGEDPPKRRVYGQAGRFSRSVSRDALTSVAAALSDQHLQ